MNKQTIQGILIGFWDTWSMLVNIDPSEAEIAYIRYDLARRHFERMV